MEQRARRWLIRAGVAAFLLISLATTAFFLAYWYVLWPIPPKWVAIHSPWTAPQVRALAIVHLWGTDLDTVHQGQSIISTRFREQSAEVEAGVLECMRSNDSNTRFMAFTMVYYLKRQAALSPEICAEIVRGIEDPEASPRSVARNCVVYLPPEQSLPIFAAWLRTDNPELRFLAVDGLAKPGAFELTAIVLPWLGDKDYRYSVLRVLARIQDPAAVPHVRPLLQDPTESIREAAEAFMRIMEPAPGSPDRELPNR